MVPFDSLGGHYGLQTASEVRSDLRFEISDLNYLHIHVHIVYMVLGLFNSKGGHYSLQTAAEVKSDLRFGISDPNYICDPKFQGLFISQKMLKTYNQYEHAYVGNRGH